MTNESPDLARRRAASWLALGPWAAALAACGGGGGGSDAPATEGSMHSLSTTSAINGTAYPLNVYMPPASAGNPAALPVIYVLDGSSWFQPLVGIAEATRTRVLIVAIGNEALRGRDFVPANSCTGGGGGQAAYLAFLRQELTPLIESRFGGDPRRRGLFGHSHGGSFVLYAVFAQAAGQHHFSAYVASDSSISCMPNVVSGWEQAYHDANPTLPVRLHLSWASQGNANPNAGFGDLLAQRRYAGLALQAQGYNGTHSGIVPAAYTDALAFSLAA